MKIPSLLGTDTVNFIISTYIGGLLWGDGTFAFDYQILMGIKVFQLSRFRSRPSPESPLTVDANIPPFSVKG